MKKITIGLITLIAIIVSVGIVHNVYACGGWFSSACDSNSTQLKDLANNQAAMVTAVPMPILTNSMERQNIAARAKLFDSPDKISYIYLVSYGKVMAFYTVKGKVSSLNSYMSPQTQIVQGDGTSCWQGNTGCYTVQAPDIDGSYGVNTDGIFFFTTSGAYVEWKGDYMMADQPLNLFTPPEMVQTVK